jgi:Rieske Fe-S protein
MKKIFGIIMISLSLFASCDKGNGSSPIPYVPINRSITLSNPQYNALFGIGGYIILPEEGAGGVLAVRATDDQIFAFDLQCTHDANDPESATRPDDSDLFLDCPVCESQWLLLNGQLNKGPATFPLLQYQTSFDGFILKIYN